MPDLRKLTTEKRNSATMKLDEMTPYEIISIMNREDHNVIEAVHRHCRILKLLFCGQPKAYAMEAGLFISEQEPAGVWECWML